jgi:hypothetical protein
VGFHGGQQTQDSGHLAHIRVTLEALAAPGSGKLYTNVELVHLSIWYYVNDANPNVPKANVPNSRVPNLKKRQPLA